jgi:hypothetical protein
MKKFVKKSVKVTHPRAKNQRLAVRMAKEPKKVVSPRGKRLPGGMTAKQWETVLSAALTKVEYKVLSTCRRDQPSYVAPDNPDLPVLKKLAKMGLLEGKKLTKFELSSGALKKDGSFLYRCTDRGEDIRTIYNPVK